MEKQQLQQLFKAFLSKYDAESKDSIWAKQGQQFKDFWNKRIVSDDRSEPEDAEIDQIVRILDRNAKGNTRESEAVARTMITQGAWRRMFRGIKRKNEFSKVLDEIFLERDIEAKSGLINKLYKLNEEKHINNLTGPSGNAVCSMLAAFDPIRNLSIISLNDRHRLYDFLGIESSLNFDSDSVGHKIVLSNEGILRYFINANLQYSARTISFFLYSPEVKPLWKIDQEDSERTAPIGGVTRSPGFKIGDARQFAAKHGLAAEARKIQSMPIDPRIKKKHVVRKAAFVLLFEKQGIIDEFVSQHWPARHTKAGERRRQSYLDKHLQNERLLRGKILDEDERDELLPPVPAESPVELDVTPERYKASTARVRSDSMQAQRYSVNQHLVEIILAWVRSGEIAIPEIQRPFVWDATKVRNLMDSLYNGYPIGYLISWKNPNVRLKDGSLSEGKKILIDGQQRVSALMAAVLGHPVISKDYQRLKIRIAFHPLDERFEVSNPAIQKDVKWIPDISTLLDGQQGLIRSVKEYCRRNLDADELHVENALSSLMQITKKQVGLIELTPDLDIETVTEIFVRINSEGVVLSQADFAMSKIAASEKYGGPPLRKAIDYFCHLAIAPEFYSTLQETDKEFVKTNYFQKMAWLRDEQDDLYDPSYTDLLRVAFTSSFDRGRLSDLVSLLSGRNFETRQYEEEIARESFTRLSEGVTQFMNETSFKRFLMIIRSAGFIDSSMLRSQNVLNFGYILYLKLRAQGKYRPNEIESFVRRWIVLSILTGRYAGSPETRFDFDVKQVSQRPFHEFLHDTERADLSDAFWEAALVQSMNTSVASSPYLHVFWAAQVKANDPGFLSRDIKVQDLISQRGDIHHVFPRQYLKNGGMKRERYNQIGNYAYTQSEINIQVGNKAPKVYFAEMKEQCNAGPHKYGGIRDLETLKANMEANCIPDSIFDMAIDHYDQFLEERRTLMARKIRDYYRSL